jgi:hypothetical protein
MKISVLGEYAERHKFAPNSTDIQAKKLEILNLHTYLIGWDGKKTFHANDLLINTGGRITRGLVLGICQWEF